MYDITSTPSIKSVDTKTIIWERRQTRIQRLKHNYKLSGRVLDPWSDDLQFKSLNLHEVRSFFFILSPQMQSYAPSLTLHIILTWPRVHTDSTISITNCLNHKAICMVSVTQSTVTALAWITPGNRTGQQCLFTELAGSVGGHASYDCVDSTKTLPLYCN